MEYYRTVPSVAGTVRNSTVDPASSHSEQYSRPYMQDREGGIESQIYLQTRNGGVETPFQASTIHRYWSLLDMKHVVEDDAIPISQ